MNPKTSALPNIEDVAAAAGVSTATVSRVLNQPSSVRETLRKRVTDAIAQLGYVPHAGARALKLQRSGTIGAIFPTIDNAIFAKSIHALQARLALDGLQLLIATSGYNIEAETQQAVNLVTRGADGLVLVGTGQSPLLLQFLRQRSLPVVHTMSFPAPAGMDCVGFDNARAMAQAVRYLIDLGHRHIAMLAGIVHDNDRAAERVRGVQEALAKAGLDLPAHYLVERPYGLADAREGFRALMAAKPRPTAVLCGNDVLAVGAILEAKALGLEVPRAVSIIGFDDLEIARHVQPALTTLHVPTQQMWETVAERLVAKLEGAPLAPAMEVEVGLVVRESTGPAPITARRKSGGK